MKSMLRGCLLSLLLWAALSVGYFFWLDTVFERPTSYWASALVGFIVLCCLGAIINARNAYRDWSLLSAGRRGLPPRDGKMIAVSGTIHPIGQPLVAPFSGVPCVVCEYDLSRQRRNTGSQNRENAGSDFAGFLMTPCVIRTAGGDIKLLGYPVLDGFGDTVHHSYASVRRAIDFLTTREFENRTGLKMVTVLAVFDDVWSDEDGHVEKNMRLGKISLPDLFPPELEAEIDRQLLIEQGKPAEAKVESIENEDDDDYDDDDEEDLNDDDSREDGELGGKVYSTPEVPQMTEKRVNIGEEVCAIGRYNEVRGGLLPLRGSTTPNRLLRGSAETLESKSRSAIVSYLIGGIVGLAVAHGATYGVMIAYTNSPEMVRHRQKEAFPAVEKGDTAKLERLARRGMNLNLRNTSDETLLMAAKDADIAAWLIQHGADVNAVDKNGETALMKAARAGRADMVKLLIDVKADLNLRSTEYNLTALMSAVDNRHADVAELLRQAGAEDDVVTAASGQPLPADGGPQLAVCLGYLQAIRDRDPAALQARYSKSSKSSFADVDWGLWQRTRPAQVEQWTGFVRGDNATLTLTGPSGAGYPVTWVYQLRRTEGEWRIARERQFYGDSE